jgi:hypothetical protein
MGSDMMIAVTRAPRFNAAATREYARIMADRNASRKDGRYVVADFELWSHVAMHVGGERSKGNEIDAEDFDWREDYLYDDPEHVYPEAQLQRWFAEALRDVFLNHRREVTELTLDGTDWLATGGGSWGDVPTEVYNQIVLLDRYRIFYRLITVVELRAAIRALEKPQPIIESVTIDGYPAVNTALDEAMVYNSFDEARADGE